MTIVYFAIALLGLTGCLSLIHRRIGQIGCFAGLLTGLAALMEQSWEQVAIWFTLPVLLVGGCAAIHALGYLKDETKSRQNLFWLFYNLLLAAMLWVTQAETPFRFLIAWELMGAFSFALVAYEYHAAGSLKAAWGYLLACEAGGLLLMLAISFGHHGIGSLLLAAMIIAFGLKIGLPGLHTWLPEAHPAAPAPVSALMSGAMIPLGFFGLLKFASQSFLFFSSVECRALGWCLLVCGIIAAPLAILLGASQNNLKRLLAYSSVENMGVIAMGFGLVLISLGTGNITLFKTAYAGALIHLLNHAFLKGTLFLGAGSVLKATGTLSIDAMGGLAKRMPKTATLMFISAMSLSGLPPFNGFIGEFLIYYAAFHGLLSGSTAVMIVSGAVILSLALTGGLAAAVYAKIIGGVFLGEPRSTAAAEAQEASPSMLIGMKLLTLLSAVMFFASPWICLQTRTGTDIAHHVWMVCLISAALLLLTGLLLVLRRLLPRGKEVTTGPTWDCGYAKPTARMAYTGTAFVQPIIDYFSHLLSLHREQLPAEGLFPVHAAVVIKTQDAANRLVWQPVYQIAMRMADAIHRLQSGSLHLYLLIMVLSLLGLLAWGFCFAAEVVK